MKGNLNILIGAITGILLTFSAISSHEIRTLSSAKAESSFSVQAFQLAENQDKLQVLQADADAPLPDISNNDVSETTVAPTEIPSDKVQAVEVAKAPDKNVTISRGTAPSSTVETKEAKTEALDWWKEARYVFESGDVATVKDLYTGKTFKVKRTMGTNHSDTEALTAEDTKIIKSIWGGFSWDRRPVHIYINGRVLAASMSAMPHAGIDSAPAYAYVKNRSDGYGSGENLDVIKNNGMDGHFDIHFLNSTRHKDGEIDPEHQAMIKIASKK